MQKLLIIRIYTYIISCDLRIDKREEAVNEYFSM